MARPRTRSDDEILDAVGRVLRAVGPHALTFQHVAREAELSPATLVQRFGNKRAMLLAFSERAARTAAELDVDDDADARAVDRITHRFVRLAREVTSRDELIHGLAMLVEDMRDDALRRAARAHAAAVETRVQGLLRDAVARGELREHDAGAVARTLVAIYNGALVAWGLAGEGSIADTITRALRPMLEALATAESPVPVSPEERAEAVRSRSLARTPRSRDPTRSGRRGPR